MEVTFLERVQVCLQKREIHKQSPLNLETIFQFHMAFDVREGAHSTNSYIMQLN